MSVSGEADSLKSVSFFKIFSSFHSVDRDDKEVEIDEGNWGGGEDEANAEIDSVERV